MAEGHFDPGDYAAMRAILRQASGSEADIDLSDAEMNHLIDVARELLVLLKARVPASEGYRAGVKSMLVLASGVVALCEGFDPPAPMLLARAIVEIAIERHEAVQRLRKDAPAGHA